MFVLIFFIILSVLVFVHELGHFIFAKLSGVKVKEFGFGYPPRAAKIGTFKGTEITLNWLPFGGFVNIFGENYDEQSAGESFDGKKFTEVNKFAQISILIAGVFFNFLLAWLFLASTFLLGTPYPKDGPYGERIQNTETMITSILPSSPADTAGIKTGDVIQNITRGTTSISQTSSELSPDVIAQFVGNSSAPINIEVKRGAQKLNFNITPTQNNAENKLLIGIGMDEVGTLKLPVLLSLKEGLISAWEILKATVLGLLGLITGLFAGKADLSQVAGPIGIVSLVKDAYQLGLLYLISFTAIISINLAVINLIPFPALDGGRILIVLIEAIKGSPLNPKLVNSLNTVGFSLLILLMAVITLHDIVKLF